ncbi:hypothetical protein HELRODRAFT_190915 [Helobdella robusta]|uniref:SH3 domain-containing protein n=1 Tax=Helobdella robusta TaxID=6412 RepID=T1FSF0_HELRO|nr:hypothetical protein HELRODRAFT_190915 [Helobdella robusta]ESO08150.1 hypothetical protein HELRODRAFT_190915 [Helobdella robusta]
MSTFEHVISWINNKTNYVSTKRYPHNYTHINEGLHEFNQLKSDVQQWQHNVDNVVAKSNDSNQRRTLLSAYEKLKTLIKKKLHCLETMMRVSQLEENINQLSCNFDRRATELSELVENCDDNISNNNDNNNNNKNNNNNQQFSSSSSSNYNIAGFISTSAQDCIFGLRDNWEWLAEAVRCSSIHLKHAADYHKFFHEVEETFTWLDGDLKKFQGHFEVNHPSREDQGRAGDPQDIIKDIDAVNVALRQWGSKVTRIWNDGNKLNPVPQRVNLLFTPLPATVLTDYETNEIKVEREEEILLLDNSQSDRWKIKNGRGQEGYVPSLVIVIPGPDKKCQDAADKLRLHLLATWTNLLKRVGVRLICYTITAFQPDYNDEEITALKQMNDITKSELLSVLTRVEEALRKHWADHEGFVSIQERVSALRMILEEMGDDETSENYKDICRTMIVKIKTLGQIINIYQDLNRNWEKFKVQIEASQAPDLMMIVDKWEQLQFVSREYFSKFWKMNLPLNEHERRLMNARTFTMDGIQFEDAIEMSTAAATSSSASSSSSSPAPNIRPQSATITIVPKTAVHSAKIKLASLDDQIQFNVGLPQENHVTCARIMAKATFPTVRFTVDLNQNQQTIGDVETRECGFSETKVVESRVIKCPEDGRGGAGGQDAVDHLFKKLEAGGFDETCYALSSHSYFKGDNNNATDSAATSATAATDIKIANEKHDNIRINQSTQEFGFEDTHDLTTTTKFERSGSGSNIDHVENRITSSGRQLTQAGQVRSSESGEKWSTDDDAFSLSRASGSDYEGTAFGIATETKTAETEELSSAEVEESKTFVIGGVIHRGADQTGKDDKEVSLQDAILLGIIIPADGIYVDGRTGKRIAIATAMSDGFIRVVHCRTKRSKEKFSSIGIITIKTVRETVRPYTVLWVKNTLTGESLEPREASAKGILDEKLGCFIDARNGDVHMLVDAAEKDLAKLEYPDESIPEPETIIKTYAVRAVVDRRLKKTVTFHEAVKRGLIDRDSGAFRDTVTGEYMYVGDAIMRGFLKARLIEDASGLNIDPQNKMVIDKTKKIRAKLLNPLKVISAFKNAAAAAAKRSMSSVSSDGALEKNEDANASTETTPLPNDVPVTNEVHAAGGDAALGRRANLSNGGWSVDEDEDKEGVGTVESGVDSVAGDSGVDAGESRDASIG